MVFGDLFENFGVTIETFGLVINLAKQFKFKQEHMVLNCQVVTSKNNKYEQNKTKQKC